MKNIKSLVKKNLEDSYTDLKILIENLGGWLKKTKPNNLTKKVKNDYEKLKKEADEILNKLYEMKSSLIQDEYIKIDFNWFLIPIIFNKKTKTLKIGNENFKLFNIQIWKDIKSKDIKIKDFLIKKRKPVLSILIPSLTAKKFWLAKNTSKHLTLEWVIKREDIAEVSKWLLIYGKWNFKLKMNNLDVKVEIEKVN